jgi:AcrR family transcriptional regulator
MHRKGDGMSTDSDTRARILAAATAIVTEGAGERPSVRAVAARAGVGASTLRHYFPTQRQLFDAVMSGLYAEALPDDLIHDRGRPARERLIGSLRNMLVPVGHGAQARESWRSLFEIFIDADASEASRAAYPFLVSKARTRVEGWLDALVAEGALAPGAATRRANFLITVVDGLSIDRAFPPTEDASAENEETALGIAVDAVFAGIADGMPRA